MQHIKHLLEQEIETLATPTNTVIPASTRAAIEFDFGFETFGEKKLCEMLSAAKDYVREMGIGAAPRWLSLLGWSGTGKTHLARGISGFFKAHASTHIDPETGARLGRRGGFIGWRKIVDHLRDGDAFPLRNVDAAVPDRADRRCRHLQGSEAKTAHRASARTGPDNGVVSRTRLPAQARESYSRGRQVGSGGG